MNKSLVLIRHTESQISFTYKTHVKIGSYSFPSSLNDVCLFPYKHCDIDIKLQSTAYKSIECT